MRRGLIRTAMELDTHTAETIEAPLEQVRNSIRTAQGIIKQHYLKGRRAVMIT